MCDTLISSQAIAFDNRPMEARAQIDANARPQEKEAWLLPLSSEKAPLFADFNIVRRVSGSRKGLGYSQSLFSALLRFASHNSELAGFGHS
jgi:hypothetical protein